MKEKRIKKTPRDYPQIQFKVTEEKKIEITNRIKAIVDLYNEKRNEDELMYRNNDVALMALEKGLSFLEQKIK